MITPTSLPVDAPTATVPLPETANETVSGTLRFETYVFDGVEEPRRYINTSSGGYCELDGPLGEPFGPTTAYTFAESSTAAAKTDSAIAMLAVVTPVCVSATTAPVSANACAIYAEVGAALAGAGLNALLYSAKPYVRPAANVKGFSAPDTVRLPPDSVSGPAIVCHCGLAAVGS